MLISEIKTLFKEVFDEEKGVIKSVDTVYEKSEEGDYLKLVISIHCLSADDTIIIHTKFIFKTDLKKVNIIENYFNYLYDINCIYRKVNFTDTSDLKNILIKIIEANKFGKDIQTLSEFIDTPGLLLSHYFSQNNITKYSIGNVKYEPKFKIKPCNETTFDFIIDVSNYIVSVTILKNNTKEKTTYKFIFKLLNKTEEVIVDSLTNMHYTIGGKLVEMLDEILK